MILTFLAALLVSVTPRGDVAQKFARTVPMPSKCYVDGKVKMREVKIKTGPNKGKYRKIRDCVIDHIFPLECGGPDTLLNMQWQTHAESLIKDRTEKLCR